MTKIISFVNQKGGTGKTTAAINISTGLAIRNYKVLIIDLEPQSNATLSFAIEPNSISKSMHEVLVDNIPISQVTVPTSTQNLTLAPAKMELSNVFINLSNRINNQLILKKALTGFKKNYDFILIDCPPSLDLLSINALSASDLVIIPVLCDYFSLEGLKQLINSINLVKKNLNSKLHILGILPNMVDYRRNLTKESLSLIRSNFKNLVFKTEIRVCVSLAEAPSYGKNIFDYDSNSTGAKAYKKLVSEIIKRSK